MKVLVTRPSEAAGRTVAALTARGWTAIASPVLEIVGTEAPWPRGVVDAVVATSAEAFERLATMSERLRPEARRLMPLFLVGQRTATAAAAAGFAGRAWIAPDAEGLVQLIETGLAPGRRLLFLAGHDRKPRIEDAVPALGQRLDVLEVYEARAATAFSAAATAALADGSFGAALHYSQRSARVFCDLAKAAHLDPAGLIHVCISEDAAMPLSAAGCQRIAVAAEPKEDAMMAILAALAPQPGGASD